MMSTLSTFCIQWLAGQFNMTSACGSPNRRMPFLGKSGASGDAGRHMCARERERDRDGNGIHLPTEMREGGRGMYVVRDNNSMARMHHAMMAVQSPAKKTVHIRLREFTPYT